MDYTHTGEVMFFAGATNVILDTRARQQRFHCEHTDEVTCLAKHPSRTLVATGQQGAVPSILIWDYEANPDGGNLPMLKMLHAQHADVHKVSSNGEGALELAKWARDSDDIAEWLKSVGVKPQEGHEHDDHEEAPHEDD